MGANWFTGFIFLVSVIESEGYMSNMMGEMGGGMGGGAMGMGGSAYLPPGFAMINGELVDMSNKLIQRVGGGGGGTDYYSWSHQKGPPIFHRREMDTMRRFIVFPDRSYPLGDGHYVVLRKFMRGKGVRHGGNIYEAFYLDLGDSINAMVTNFNTLSPASPSNFRRWPTRISGYGS